MHHGQGFLSPPSSPLSSCEASEAQGSSGKTSFLLLPLLIVLRGRRSTELHR